MVVFDTVVFPQKSKPVISSSCEDLESAMSLYDNTFGLGISHWFDYSNLSRFLLKAKCPLCNDIYTYAELKPDTDINFIINDIEENAKFYKKEFGYNCPTCRGMYSDGEDTWYYSSK